VFENHLQVATARNAAGLAQARGFTVPPGVTVSLDLVSTAHTLAAEHRAPQTPPPIPDDPTAMRGALKKAVAAVTSRTEGLQIIDQWTDHAEQMLACEVGTAVPAWIADLSDLYDRQLEALTANGGPARYTHAQPARMSAHEIGQWQACLAAVDDLEQILRDRTVLGAAGGENRTDGVRPTPSRSRAFGGQTVTAGVLHPQTGEDRTAIDHEFQHRDTLLTTAHKGDVLNRWALWLQASAEGWLTLALPRLGEPATRNELLRGLAETGWALLDNGTSLRAGMAHADQTYRGLVGAQ
jgi:hypothetical protein